jgi:hypothetical protein
MESDKLGLLILNEVGGGVFVDSPIPLNSIDESFDF